MDVLKRHCQKIAASVYFERLIIGLILTNGVLLGLETLPGVYAQFGAWMEWAHHVILGVFILEVVIKLIAVAPKFGTYFRNGWNLFDFSVVMLSLLPATGELAMLARLARLFRVLRLISTLPELRLIVSTLVRSIPSMGNVMLLMGLIFYIYAVAGYHLFHVHDPEHWRNLGMALLTLFRIVTLEDWTDVMYTGMALHPAAWIYFVSFVLVGTFVTLNLFIAVVLNNLDEAKQAHLKAQLKTPDSKEILAELAQMQQTLKQLERRLQ